MYTTQIMAYLELYDELEKIRIPYTTVGGSGHRHGFPRHQKMTFGLVRPRKMSGLHLSAASKRYPHIYTLLREIGDAICPFNYSSIHINRNVVCPPHYDSSNVSESCIVSFGDYEGGELVIEDPQTGECHTCDTLYNPVIFNGAKEKHWNNPILAGTKYSLVFYTTSPRVVKSPLQQKKGVFGPAARFASPHPK
jgi:hypothetical protein